MAATRGDPAAIAVPTQVNAVATPAAAHVDPAYIAGAVARAAHVDPALNTLAMDRERHRLRLANVVLVSVIGTKRKFSAVDADDELDQPLRKSRRWARETTPTTLHVDSYDDTHTRIPVEDDPSSTIDAWISRSTQCFDRPFVPNQRAGNNRTFPRLSHTLVGVWLQDTHLACMAGGVSFVCVVNQTLSRRQWTRRTRYWSVI